MRLAPFLEPVEVIGQPLPATAAKPAPVSLLRRAFSFPVLVGAFLMLGVFTAVWMNFQSVQSKAGGYIHASIIEGDTWYDILSGEQILKTHTLPSNDTWSFTAKGGEAPALEWLGQLVVALAYGLGGLRALAALLILLAASVKVLIYCYATLRSGNSKAAFLACIPILPMVSAFFTLRPQLLGYIFLLCTMICLERFRQGRKKAIWFLPLIFLLWVNTHGSFILGLVVLGVYWASGLVHFRWGSIEAVPWTPRQRRQMSVAATLFVFALLVTPYGARIVGYTFHVILHANLGMSYIVEYKPLADFGLLLNIFLVLLLSFVFAQVTVRPIYRLEEILLLLFTVCGAWVHMRLLFFFIIVFAPMLATLLTRWAPRYDARKDHYFVNAVLMLIISAVLIRFFPSDRLLKKVVACAFPSGAVEYLRHHSVPQPMFNNDLWGHYLTFSLGPSHKVFIDGRSQLYEDAGVLEDYLRIIDINPDALLLLNKYGINSCVIERDSPLATLLRASRGWKTVYQDNLGVIFVRRDSHQRVQQGTAASPQKVTAFSARHDPILAY